MGSVPEENPKGDVDEELPNWEDCYDENGVDISLIDWMLSLTPIERLRYLQNHANAIIRLQNASSKS